MGHEIGAHHLAHFAGFTIHMDTMYMTWLTMAIVILIALLATRRLKLVPSGWQNVLEMAVEALLNQIKETMGPKGVSFAPMIITLFLFLLVGNWLGLVPGLSSPTSDLNTTLGLALMVIIMVQLVAIMNKGLSAYLGHFIKPMVLFLPINIIEELSKPITLSFRLFGNIMAGEILIIVLGMLVPYVIPTAWLAFSVFVGVIQAFIFTMLSMSYLSSGLNDEGH
ncbi:F-type H+-transporting ATPase subunit a [Sporomusaceae bacterium BoRhaA]|jgi:F-type H+-transporting ATPase subunit a|uniref:F0F1 ATP synthase subunit A n=1 Tax=Pelorhabdus rhamnosifermentans TaxID=2772457 RepID=UPI001C06010D|nr:F0F1 ATP synthase subunit A [Pelorhabdus rhamnosifermentans]MBU2698930.1 F-type H+-transporting ATPase subunit a [Pelorhabdus rhamnosifermentans]